MTINPPVLYLLSVPVRDGNPLANGYRPLVERMPMQHWILANEVYIRDGPHGRTSWSNGHIAIGLPPTPDLRVLEHELGHVVFHGRRQADGKPLAELWERSFWRKGKAQGQTTDYGKTDPDEDGADSYKAVLRGNRDDISAKRWNWIVQHLFDNQTPVVVR